MNPSHQQFTSQVATNSERAVYVCVKKIRCIRRFTSVVMPVYSKPSPQRTMQTNQGHSGGLAFGPRSCVGIQIEYRVPALQAALRKNEDRSDRVMMTENQPTPMPGESLQAEKMPGHWLLARLGKRVLRPGGRELTCRMIEALNIGASDEVIEFAPGLGETAQLTLNKKPASYSAVERDKDAAALVQKFLQGPKQRCVVGLAEDTGLPDASATVVYGEAMLSMQTPQQKSRIVGEAYRLLKPSGRYGIHELCLIPDDLAESTKREIQNDLSTVIHHGTRPLTTAEWQGLLEAEGFLVQTRAQAPMHLLEPWRIVQDEGILGALRFACNLLCNREARRRVLGMRRVFRRNRDNLAAVVFVAQK